MRRKTIAERERDYQRFIKHIDAAAAATPEQRLEMLHKEMPGVKITEATDTEVSFQLVKLWAQLILT